MLESRLIAGNEELFKTYSETMEKNLNLKKFYRAKFIGTAAAAFEVPRVLLCSGAEH